MKNYFETYINSISAKAKRKETSEMGYRTDFEILLKNIFESIKVKDIGHDDRAVQGNRPDFIIHKNNVPILYIEAKDIGTDLNKEEKSEQMARYYGYTNLVLSDYVEFRFYRNGLPYEEPIKIADYDKNTRTVYPIPKNYEHVARTLIEITQTQKEPIRTGKHLSQIMGGKAQRIRDNIREFLSKESEKNDSIIKVYEAIKKQLVHDLTLNSFADMYAQTLVYGLFVARYHDETPDNFTRQEARDLIPESNPLLRHFFDHIAGTDFDKRLEHIVNELCEVFTHADVKERMREYYKTDLWDDKHEEPDPVIHFYEDFLKEYDPELRKKLGAFYTPLPVVRFIARSVDLILKKDFKLASGLADTSKLPNGKHRVQILDPATGTGTFICAVIKIVHDYIKKTNQPGRWGSYVFHDLLPRLHGFEIMMAPYTISHLKMSMLLKDTGFKYFNNSRLGIYLTNSLEESYERDDLFGSEIGFAGSIAEESREASKVKKQTPIMVVIGNPPYSISSSNKNRWIDSLVDVYKKDLNEQNVNALSDDYVKFIRFAEHYIEKNGNGIIAMITNHAFIYGVTHCQMRKHLLETFDKIYIIDLHGNVKKKERAPDGSKDENVFDIEQGVSISIFIRNTQTNKQLGEVYHSDLFGKREDKFITLNKSNIKNINWQKLNYSRPYYFFVPKDFPSEDKYNESFQLNELFINTGSGIKFRKDNLLVRNHFTSRDVIDMINNINILDEVSIHTKYKFEDTSDWSLKEKKEHFIIDDIESIQQVKYRPFDKRYTYYPFSRINQIIPRGDSRLKLMKHLCSRDNFALISGRQGQVVGQMEWNLIFVSENIVDMNIFYRGGGVVFPLYIYSNEGTKIPNLKKEIVNEIENKVGKVTPENILDYIYAVLHSPTYREKYKEFLKIDFPRIPYPKDKNTFKKLVALGNELRLLHLLESPKVNQFITTFPNDGSDEVIKLEYKKGNVYINHNQYFGNVPDVAWNFYIGGYQPAQKWLKDRKGRTLTNEDLEHYQKIIVALTETDRIMKEIDKIEIE